MKEFYKFTENNDWEGESWNFYIALSREEHNQLNKLLESCPTESYELDPSPIKEKEVDVLVNNSDVGYIKFENKANKFQPFPKKINWEKNDPFYKGQYWG